MKMLAGWLGFGAAALLTAAVGALFAGVGGFIFLVLPAALLFTDMQGAKDAWWARWPVWGAVGAAIQLRQSGRTGDLPSIPRRRR